MEKKLKVLEVLDCYRPSVDGPILCIENYAKCLSEDHNVEVELMVPKYPKYKDSSNFKIHRIFSIVGVDKYRTPLPMFSRKARKIFKENKYDLIHIHSPFTMGKFAAKMAKKYNIPCVCTVHTKYKSDFERKLKSKLMQDFMMRYILKTMNLSTRLLTVSDGAKETLKEYGYQKSIEVVRNGTDLKYPENPQKLIADVNEKYNLHNENMVFLFVGRIVENKNIDFSLRALKLLREKNPNFKFLIVGTGIYEKKLKKLVEEYNLKENVIFTGLISNRNELSGIFLRSDLFLFPSTFDTFGLVSLEAATMKTPSFVLENTCASECIQDGFNGFVGPENEQVWAEKLEQCLKNKMMIENMKENAYKTIYKSWNTITNEIYEIYLDTIENYKKETK